jgi:hypothetical protein
MAGDEDCGDAVFLFPGYGAVAIADPLRYARDLARWSAQGTLAVASLTANRAVARQVEAAFDLGRALRNQARQLQDTAQNAVPAGPWRDTLTWFAQAQTRGAELMITQAITWGRRFGGLAFAFPLPDRAR